MEMHTNTVGLQSGGTFQGEESFGIGDPGFLMGVLRKQLYSNPIKAICQEYASNARDANREVGLGNQPILITLPNGFSPEWKCRDFGPGITPERMSQVFLLMGNSTKRSDNSQTGGFGLGAKCAFGYCDQWTVTTFINGVKRIYIATVTDDNRGKLVLVTTEATTEPNGTEIAVPVEAKDFGRFQFETVKATRNWDVHPTFACGTKLSRFREKTIITGSNWFVIGGSNGREYTALVDGIEYPVDVAQIPGECRVVSFSYGTRVCMEFKTGEVNVAVSRESLEYNPRTIKALCAVLENVRKELDEQIEREIADCTNYIAANLKKHEIISRLGIAQRDGLKWKGLDLFGEQIRTDGMEFMTYNVMGGKAAKVGKHSTNYLQFSEEVVYAWFDRSSFDKLAETAAAAIIRNFPGKSRVVLARKGFGWEKDYNKYNLAQLGFVETDTFYTPKERKASLGRLTIYRYSAGSFSRTSLAGYEEVPSSTTKVWCLIHKKQRQADSNVIDMRNGKTLPEGHLQPILDAMRAEGKKVEVFAVTTDVPESKYEPLTEEMYHLSDVIHEFVENLDCLPEMRWLNSESGTGYYTGFRIRALGDQEIYLKALEDKGLGNTEIAKLLRDTCKAYKKNERISCLMPLLSFDKGDSKDTKDYVEAIEKRKFEVASQYPMLKYAFLFQHGHSYTSLSKFTVPDFVNYVEMVEVVGLSPKMDTSQGNSYALLQQLMRR